MTASRRCLARAGLAGLALIGLLTGAAPSADRGDAKVPTANPAKPPLDRGKSLRIEPAIANVVKNASNPFAGQPGFGVGGGFPRQPNGQPVFGQPGRRMDFGKSSLIEPQVQQFVQFASTPNAVQPGFQPPAPKTEFVNPKVMPGKVR